MMNFIYSLLDGGLGNKFNCLFTCVLLSQKYNKLLKINNVRNNFSDFDLKNLFDFDFEYTEFKVSDFDSSVDSTVPIILHKKHFDFKRPIINEEKISLNVLKNESVLYLTDKFKFEYTDELFSKIKIKENILNKVLSFVEQNNINDSTMGLHIRGTDFPKKKTIKSQALNSIKSNKSKKIFICTDDEEIENEFKSYDNVFFYKKNNFVQKLDSNSDWNGCITDSDNRKWNYNVLRNNECMIESFIEMLILSRTNLHGSNGSTFFNWASRFKKLNF